MCAESKHRKKFARSDVTLKSLRIYVKVASFCKQHQGSFTCFTTFLSSNGSKIFSVGHIHVMWVLERSALMSSFERYQNYGHTIHTAKNLRANRKNVRWVTNWISILSLIAFLFKFLKTLLYYFILTTIEQIRDLFSKYPNTKERI